MQVLGGGDFTVAEVHRLIGSGSLDVEGYMLLGGVVIIIAALCMLTSRFGVFRILNSKP
jgi:cell division transport system permease protein